MKLFTTMTGIIKTLTFSGSLIILFTLAAGCLQNDWEEKEEKEKKIIADYLADNNISESNKTDGGIYYIEKTAGTGASPVLDDYIIIEYVGRYIEDDMIRETTYDSLKADWSAADVFTNYVYGPVKFKFGYSVPGLNEGIAMMKEGGKALLVLPSDKAFYDFNPMSYEIELLRVIPDPAEYEDAVLEAYLDAKGFDAATTYADNGDTIWFKETVTPDPGDEKTIEQGDTVLFRFKGRLVDGFGNVLQDERIFDSNMGDDNPVKIVFSSTPSKKSGNILAIPRGLVMALDSMRIGTHATAVLPYAQAFDDGGITSSTYGYTIVPPYQTIIYDIIVEDIQSPAGK